MAPSIKLGKKPGSMDRVFPLRQGTLTAEVTMAFLVIPGPQSPHCVFTWLDFESSVHTRVEFFRKIMLV